LNADNLLRVPSAAVADIVSRYIEHLIAKYQATGTSIARAFTG
jgi:hypothetical protein